MKLYTRSEVDGELAQHLLFFTNRGFHIERVSDCQYEDSSIIILANKAESVSIITKLADELYSIVVNYCRGDEFMGCEVINYPLRDEIVNDSSDLEIGEQLLKQSFLECENDLRGCKKITPKFNSLDEYIHVLDREYLHEGDDSISPYSLV